MTEPERIAAGLREALPGDYADDAIRMTIRAQDAIDRGAGIRLTANEVVALQILAGSDGDWWGTIHQHRKELRAILERQADHE